MKFYHGTSKESWEAIQKEGILWSSAPVNVPTETADRHRYTWLSPEEEAARYGEVLLEVDWDWPKSLDWQIVVREPIPLDRIRRIR